MLFQQQGTETLFEAIDLIQCRMMAEIGGQAGSLIGVKVVTMPAHQRDELAPAAEKVMIHQTNDVESIGDNAGVGEVLAHQRAIAGRQVHAYDPDMILAF